MNRLFLLLGLAGTLFVGPGAAAQPSMLDFEHLDTLFGDEPTVEVNLRGSLLRLAAEATREDEPETAALIDGLNAITVRVYPLSSALADVADDVSGFGRRLEADGWQTFVRVRPNANRPEDERDEDVWIYVREDGDVFGGLVVMALDHDEDHAAFVVIDGRIEPDQIGRLSDRFGDVDLDWDDEDEEDQEDEEDEEDGSDDDES